MRNSSSTTPERGKEENVVKLLRRVYDEYRMDGYNHSESISKTGDYYKLIGEPCKNASFDTKISNTNE